MKWHKKGLNGYYNYKTTNKMMASSATTNNTADPELVVAGTNTV
jgi:hypothetical protein